MGWKLSTSDAIILFKVFLVFPSYLTATRPRRRIPYRHFWQKLLRLCVQL